MNILITGGAGFIGSNLIRHILDQTDHSVINIDNLTYAGGEASIKDLSDHPRYAFHKIDICDRDTLETVFKDNDIDAVMHLAAESHVDRSIDAPDNFIQTNIVGTFTLLEVARKHAKDGFRFHHISTDEVYGDLEPDDAAFTETTPYNPSSPYSASKAGSDHLVRAWRRTYGLPIVITNCSNNYGPYQFPEKLIPHMILNALHGNPLPVYGDGKQIRDWLYVEDHVAGLLTVLKNGRIGETYNFGGQNEVSNIEVVYTICDILQELRPTDKPYRDLIEHVTDRPGHDRRYAIDISKIQHDLGWAPQHGFEAGLRETVQWYLDNEEWWQDLLNTHYDLKRIGVST